MSAFPRHQDKKQCRPWAHLKCGVHGDDPWSLTRRSLFRRTTPISLPSHSCLQFCTLTEFPRICRCVCSEHRNRAADLSLKLAVRMSVQHRFSKEQGWFMYKIPIHAEDAPLLIYFLKTCELSGSLKAVGQRKSNPLLILWESSFVVDASFPSPEPGWGNTEPTIHLVQL